ncbi:MAG: hypothetical protein DWQ08_10940 [Proteobacteria bacterium]|nr:MAG: hypothetical protein DWQ08_10940 [Pseudomonadota bacterium]
MTNKKQPETNPARPGDGIESGDKGRRQLLKSLGAGGALYAGSQGLPAAWNKPVIESITLPAHAQTTGGVLAGTFQLAVADRGAPTPDVLDGGNVEYATSVPDSTDHRVSAFAGALLSELGPLDAHAAPVTTTSTPTTLAPTTFPPTTFPPTTLSTSTTAAPTTPGPSGPSCPVGDCGELRFTDDKGSFILTVRGKSASGVVKTKPAVIAGVSHRVTDVDDLANPTTARITAFAGDCAPVELVAIRAPGRCP